MVRHGGLKLIKRMTLFSLRFPLAFIEEMESHVRSAQNPKGEFKSPTEGIRECARVGLQVVKHQAMMKDPAKNAEFVKKMEALIRTENYSEFTQTLDAGQLNGFIMMLQMEKERRYEQGILR